MIQVPIPTPVTMPGGVTVAIPGQEQLKEPGIVASASDVVAPTQSVIVPVIGNGAASTEIAAVRIQPYGEVSVIVAAPADTPVTTPDVELMVARVVGVMLHVPGSTSEAMTKPPTQTLDGAMIAAGTGSIVMTYEAEQPPEVVYNIVSTPATAPVTVAVVPLPATPAVALVALHIPVGSASVRVIVPPTQTCVGPDIGDGSGLIVMDLVR